MDKEHQGASGSSSSTGSGTDSTNSGNDIPYVPPTDRTNLNEHTDLITKPSNPPNIKKDNT
jgi:hypothetical protein